MLQAIRSSFAALASEALRTLALAQRSSALATKASLQKGRRDSFDEESVERQSSGTRSGAATGASFED